ncbi:hypothetical protein NEHOM01_0599 [Nematocida homosporus]|uniref:uncharacterized protein n=1 Tax=Nematocida homosporus TaxID=1912981 RepID=UPI00221EF110|nr:uncharacterized protein NEHOM01_0599 [Nematocida homosporus]KAI5185094.1 hypothetical protein NEHOM01_0599 [Nematocida homosporus]
MFQPQTSEIYMETPNYVTILQRITEILLTNPQHPQDLSRETLLLPLFTALDLAATKPTNPFNLSTTRLQWHARLTRTLTQTLLTRPESSIHRPLLLFLLNSPF